MMKAAKEADEKRRKEDKEKKNEQKEKEKEAKQKVNDIRQSLQSTPGPNNLNTTSKKQKTTYYEVNETQQNIFSKNPNQYQLDLNVLNDQLQNIYLFMCLFYTNQKSSNIYKDLLKINNSTWYEKLQNYGLIGNTENIDITQFLNPDCFFYYNTTNEQISPSTIYYNIQNTTYFIKFINSLNSALTYHSTNQLNYGTIYSDYNLNTVPQYTELVEIMYVMTFVPPTIYNIYVMPFNEIIIKFNGAIDTYEDYMQFQQLYSCANIMNFSKKNLSDNNGNIVNYINCIYPASPTESGIVQDFIKKLLPIFSDDNYVSLLEPSYIMFYKSLLYFCQKFGIVAPYTDTYNYTEQKNINIPTKPSTAKPSTKPSTTRPPAKIVTGTFDGSNFSGNYTQIKINNISNTDIINIVKDDKYPQPVIKFKKPGNYLLNINFSQYITTNGNGQGSNVYIMINMRNNNESVSNILASGYSAGNGAAPEVKDNIAIFYGKFSNNGYGYANIFKYTCTIMVEDINLPFRINIATSHNTRLGEPIYDNNRYMYNKKPTFDIREIIEKAEDL